MTLIGLILVLAICGFFAWLVLQIPMPAVVRNIVIAVMCIFVVIYVLQFFGLNTSPIPALRLW